MKRLGLLIGVVCCALSLVTTQVAKTSFAAGCCDKKECTKEAAADAKTDTKCVVCGKAVEKDKGITVGCEGKSFTVCCKTCEAEYKKDPCKFCKDEKCEKHQEHHGEEHH